MSFFYNIETKCDGMACSLTRSITNLYNKTIKMEGRFIFDEEPIIAPWKILDANNNKIRCFWLTHEIDEYPLITIENNTAIAGTTLLNSRCELNPCINIGCTLVVNHSTVFRDATIESDSWAVRLSGESFFMPYSHQQPYVEKGSDNIID